MTLFNNSTTPKKLAKLWEQNQANKVQIAIQRDTQDAIITELNRTAIRTFDNNQFINLDTDFVSPIVVSKSFLNDNATYQMYQSWSISFTGLLIEELIGVQINLVMRFGSGGSYLDTTLTQNAEVYTIRSIGVDNLTDSREATKTIVIGFYESYFAGLPEFDNKNMQLSLNIRMANPRYYN